MKKEIEISSVEYYVKGMHCGSCEIVVEDNLLKHPNVNKVRASLNKGTVDIEINSKDNINNFESELNQLIADFGYSLHVNPVINQKINFKELILAFFIALGFLSLFVSLQKFGLVNLLNADKVTLPFVFFIGVVASLSTCMAVVGGLVLSISSSYSKFGEKNYSPLLKFHLARVFGFLILGGVIGLIGSAFTLTTQTTFVISLVLFFVMIILGFNLLDIFPFFRKLQVKMPKSFSTKVTKTSFNSFTPVLLGLSTFFLPCGFTQSMQIYALTTASFVDGALIMFVFALGTLPVLALISFASIKFSQHLKSGLFFKTAGFIVIFFAIFNLLSALVAIGLIDSIGVF